MADRPNSCRKGCYEFTTRQHPGLDKLSGSFKIPGNSGAIFPSGIFSRGPSGFMTPKSHPSPQSVNMKQPCKHPRVQIVSRDQDSEFVECKECGEIFESSEFKDMNIEERTQEEI